MLRTKLLGKKERPCIQSEFYGLRKGLVDFLEAKNWLVGGEGGLSITSVACRECVFDLVYFCVACLG